MSTSTTSFPHPPHTQDHNPDDGASGPARTRWTRRRALLVFTVVVLLAVASTWLVAFSSVLGVRNVDVRGVHLLSAERVRAAAKITDGTPLVRVDTGAITGRVERLAEVASAQVATSFPSTVVITVMERVPVGYVVNRGRVSLVDRTGDQFRSVPKAPKRLPRFVVPAGTDARTTGGAVATVAAALPAGFLKRIASIQALNPDAITLLLTNRRIVRWGSAARSADKARILPRLLRQPGTQFDVTNPDLPFSR